MSTYPAGVHAGKRSRHGRALLGMAQTAPRIVPRAVLKAGLALRLAIVGLALGLAVVAAACSSRVAEIEPQALAALDLDGDGVIARTAVTAAQRRAQLEADRAAQEAQRQAEAAERAQAQADRDAAVDALAAEPDAVVARFPGGQITVADVYATFEVSPQSPESQSPESSGESPSPTHAELVARLTSMLQLRLAGAALDGLGFPVDVTAADEQINAQVQAHLEGGFEEFAQQRAIEQDPSIERLATPHCVSVLVLGSQAEAQAAADRVAAGEPLADVAAEVNPPGITEPDGTVGCYQPFELFGGGELTLALLELTPGELSEPLMLPSVESPTGELWLVLHIDELQSEQADLASIGPFAGRVLTEIMAGYEVEVNPVLGSWSAAELRVSLPPLQ